MWNPMEQMVILAIRTLFVNSDYNHSHQHDFSCVSMRSVTPRKTYWQQTHYKWSGEVCMWQTRGWRVQSLQAPGEAILLLRGGTLASMINGSPACHSQIWNAGNRIPHSPSSQLLNKGNDPRSWVCLLNWSISESKTTTTRLQLHSCRRLGYVPSNSGQTPALTKVAKNFLLLKKYCLKKLISSKGVTINCRQILKMKGF